MREKPFQNRNDDPAGVVRRKHTGGECRDYNSPQQCGPPTLEPFHVNWHASQRIANGWRERFPQSFALFQPVIWRFTRDDHVMYVALAQSSLGDTDKLAALL